MAIVEADNDTLLRQAGMTAHTYLYNAITTIDDVLGEGYAKAHPELVATYMTVCAQDFHTAMLGKVVERAVNILRGRYDE